MENLSGHTIRGYKLHECIGRGGFGAVYRASSLLPNAGHGYWRPEEEVLADFLTPTLHFFDTHLKNQ